MAHAKGFDALGWRIAIVPGADGVDGGGLGDLGNVEIRKADREIDRVLHLRREIEDLTNAGSINVMRAAGNCARSRSRCPI